MTPGQLVDFDVPGGTITAAGLKVNCSVGVRYLDAWLQGVGAAAIDNLMEDAATAEISRAQIWSWVQAGLFDEQQVREEIAEVEASDEAKELFAEVALTTPLLDFLTPTAYTHLPERAAASSPIRLRGPIPLRHVSSGDNDGFTTRPELRGTFGAVASTHWLASATGMAVLERGGNAFDAAVRGRLRPAGRRAASERARRRPPGRVLVGGARRAARALRARASRPRRRRSSASARWGTSSCPGTGLLAACVPGAFGGWIRLLRDFGTWRLEEVLAYAIGYAEHGYPVVPGITATIEQVEPLLREWPASAELYLPAPRARLDVPQPALAATWRRLLDEARGGSREDELDRAYRVFYEGFVAEEIDRFCAANGGLLTGADLASWEPTLERPGDRRLPRPDRLQDRQPGGRGPPACSSWRCSQASTSPG